MPGTRQLQRPLYGRSRSSIENLNIGVLAGPTFEQLEAKSLDETMWCVWHEIANAGDRRVALSRWRFVKVAQKRPAFIASRRFVDPPRRISRLFERRQSSVLLLARPADGSSMYHLICHRCQVAV
jgi:hypothetical protein